MTESQRLGSRGERKKEAEISFHSRAQKGQRSSSAGVCRVTPHAPRYNSRRRGWDSRFRPQTPLFLFSKLLSRRFGSSRCSSCPSFSLAVLLSFVFYRRESFPGVSCLNVVTRKRSWLKGNQADRKKGRKKMNSRTHSRGCSRLFGGSTSGYLQMKGKTRNCREVYESGRQEKLQGH